MTSVVCFVCRIGWQTGRLWTRRILGPPISYIPVRGAKKQAKKQKKTKKDIQKEMMKDYLKKRELEKLSQDAAMRAARMGEPLDPEMLNPARKRPPSSISDEEQERRFLLVKEWTRHCMEKHKQELQFLQGLVKSRERALKELKKVSPSLYLQALELNDKLFPFECQGPLATPPIPGYEPPELADS